MSAFKKFWPLIITALAALAPFFSSTAQGFWSAHPDVVAALFGIWGAVKLLLPSPVSK